MLRDNVMLLKLCGDIEPDRDIGVQIMMLWRNNAIKCCDDDDICATNVIMSCDYALIIVP